MTNEGSIVVDGVLASCYASIDQDLNHIALAPIRWFPAFIEWTFGDDNGFQTYVNILFDLGK